MAGRIKQLKRYIVTQGFLCPFENNRPYGEGQIVALPGWKRADITAATSGPSPLLRELPGEPVSEIKEELDNGKS